MLTTINQIRSIAVEMIVVTSRNDDRRDDMRDMVELCNDAISQCSDDVK